MAVTGFHFILLYHDRVCAVSSLDEKLVYEELLGLVSLHLGTYNDLVLVSTPVHTETESEAGSTGSRPG